MVQDPPESDLSYKELQALRHLRNWLVHHGRPPTVRELQVVLGYRSPRSAAEILERLRKHGLVDRGPDRRLRLLRDVAAHESHARTVGVPLVGSVACGLPMLAEQNVEAFFQVSRDIARPPHRYFALRAVGDSMDLAGIRDGDFVLVRQQATALNGERVVALIDDEATIKEFRRTAEAVLLCPRSSNTQHQPIVLTSDFQIQGVVVRTISISEET